MYEDESLGPVEKSRRLVDKVDELGLQPFEPPDPLPPIQKDEVKLVCWMVIAPEKQEEADEKGPQLMSQAMLDI